MNRVIDCVCVLQCIRCFSLSVFPPDWPTCFVPCFGPSLEQAVVIHVSCLVEQYFKASFLLVRQVIDVDAPNVGLCSFTAHYFDVLACECSEFFH